MEQVKQLRSLVEETQSKLEPEPKNFKMLDTINLSHF